MSAPYVQLVLVALLGASRLADAASAAHLPMPPEAKAVATAVSTITVAAAPAGALAQSVPTALPRTAHAATVIEDERSASPALMLGSWLLVGLIALRRLWN